MDSFNDVLDAAKLYCREHTAEATYQCYIAGLEAVSFENSNCVTLLVRNDFIRKIVNDRYAGLLKEAFKEVLGFDIELVLVIPPSQQAEGEKAPKKSPRKRCLPAGMTSLLKTLSAAHPTSLPLRRPRRWRQTLQALTTRCLSTGLRAGQDPPAQCDPD